MTAKMNARFVVPCAAVSLVAAGLVYAPPSTAGLQNAVIPTLSTGRDLATTNSLEARISDSFIAGHVVPVVYDSADQLPGHVVAAPYWGDTQLWTGVYVGGESMRYAVAKRHLAELTAQDDSPGNSTGDDGADSPGEAARAFWTAQRDQALARIRVILDAQHRDVTIAEDWTSSTKVPPAVNSQNPTGTHTADFGGVTKGERGLVTRGCTPVGMGPLGINPPSHDASNPIEDHANHVFEITWKHGDRRTYYCETSPSRDTYAGLTFGFLTAFDLVGPDEPVLRDQIRDDVLAMTGYLVKYGWNLPRPTGYISTHSDEDMFVSPLMEHVPMARLNMANAARHVADVAGTAADKQRWDGLWAEELASQGPLLGPSMEVDSAQPNDGYFKFNLHHLTGFNLLRTTSGAERDLIARGFSVMDKTTRDDINAHFEAITYAVTGDAARRDAAVTHLGQWIDYAAAVAHGQQVNNGRRCGTTLACVPKDQDDLAVDQAPGGSVTWYPGSPDAPPLSSRSGNRAALPLPVAQRPPADFLWQRSPTDLDGQQSPSWREPGIDFLTPYWMLRYYTEVVIPSPSPLPEWAGPAHR